MIPPIPSSIQSPKYSMSGLGIGNKATAFSLVMHDLSHGTLCRPKYSKPSSTISRFPQEILELIFSLLLDVPEWIYFRQLPHIDEPSSRYIRSQAFLARILGICRSWYFAGRVLLYRRPFIKSFMKLRHFKRSVVGNHALGCSVQCVILARPESNLGTWKDCHMEWLSRAIVLLERSRRILRSSRSRHDVLQDRFTQELDHIMEHLPVVTWLAVIPSDHEPISTPMPTSTRLFVQCAAFQTLRSLSLSMVFLAQMPRQPSMSHLRTLYLARSSVCDPTEWPELPTLQTLTLSFCLLGAAPPALCYPSLTSLHLIHNAWLGVLNEPLVIASELDRFSKSLAHLQLNGHVELLVVCHMRLSEFTKLTSTVLVASSTWTFTSLARLPRSLQTLLMWRHEKPEYNGKGEWLMLFRSSSGVEDYLGSVMSAQAPTPSPKPSITAEVCSMGCRLRNISEMYDSWGLILVLAGEWCMSFQNEHTQI